MCISEAIRILLNLCQLEEIQNTWILVCSLKISAVQSILQKEQLKKSEPKTTMKLVLMMSGCELLITTVNSESAFHMNNQSAH